MDPQLQELARHIADDVEKRVDKIVVTRVDEIVVKRVDEIVVKRVDAIVVKRVDEIVVKRVDAIVVKRVDEIVVKRVDEIVGKRVDAIVVKRVDEIVGKRVDEIVVRRLGEAEKRLSDGARMNMEELRAFSKLAAEGYGVTLERIERQLVELNTKWDTTIGDHAKALQDHAARITALESRQ